MRVEGPSDGMQDRSITMRPSQLVLRLLCCCSPPHVEALLAAALVPQLSAALPRSPPSRSSWIKFDGVEVGPPAKDSFDGCGWLRSWLAWS